METQKYKKNRKQEPEQQTSDKNNSREDKTEENGGPAGPEPTRYGDWERKGRCIDF